MTKTKYCLLIIALLLLSLSPASAKETSPSATQRKVTIDVLTKDSSSWDGNKIAYGQGPAEISVVKIHIPAGVILPLHCHPTPLAAYMTKGLLEVSKKSGKKVTFKAGDAFIEVMNSWHSGRSVGGDAELIAFYAGTKGIPLSVKEGDDPNLTPKCR